MKKKRKVSSLSIVEEKIEHGLYLCWDKDWQAPSYPVAEVVMSLVTGYHGDQTGTASQKCMDEHTELVLYDDWKI